MPVDVVECSKGTMNPREPGDNVERGLPGNPLVEVILNPAPADAFSSLKVSQQDVDQAAGEDHVEVLDSLWKESNGAVYPSLTGLQMAAAAGNIVTLEWAHSRGLRGFERLMDVAAWQGRLSVMKWLLANRGEVCTVNAINWAAGSGHLKVLRWLRDNIGIHECTSEGLEAASAAGHVRVVAWLLRNSRGQGPPSTPAVVGAASRGHADVLTLLLSARQPEERKSGWAVALAVRGGHLQCVRLLREAGWPSQRPVTDDEEDGLGHARAEESLGDNDERGQMLLKGFGRENERRAPPPEGDSGGGEGGRQTPLIKSCGYVGVARNSTGDRRCSSLLGEDSETSSLSAPPGEIDGRDEENEQRKRGPTPTCAQQGPSLTAAENTSLRRHPPVATGVPSARRTQSTGRVMSMDMALPGLLPEGATPSYLQELLEAPVLHTPRQRSEDPAGGKQLSDRSTTTLCSTPGSPSTTLARGVPQAEGVDAKEGRDEISCPEDWRCFLQGTSEVDDRRPYLGVEEAFAVSDKKSRVRDVWSPVSWVAGTLEDTRLNLGALAAGSQEPVISAYLEGLLRDKHNGLPAGYQTRHRPPPRSSRVLQKIRPADGARPNPLWSWQPSLPREGSPPGPASPRECPTLQGHRCIVSVRQRQRDWRRHLRCRASCFPLRENHGRIAAMGYPRPPATAPTSGRQIAAAWAEVPGSGRARTAPERPTDPPSRHRRGCGRGQGRWPHQRPYWCEDNQFASLGGGFPGAACREHRQESQKQRVEPCGWSGGRRDKCPDSFSLRQGWGKTPKNSTPRRTEGGSVNTLPALSLPPPEGSSHGLGGRCGAGFEALGSSQDELTPRNMFWTRAHRRGTPNVADPAGVDPQY